MPYTPPTKIIQNAGVTLPMHATLNFTSGAADDPAFDRTTVTISSGSGSATPTIVAGGATFTIPINTQMLFKAPCKLDGTIVVNGTRVNL